MAWTARVIRVDSPCSPVTDFIEVKQQGCANTKTDSY